MKSFSLFTPRILPLKTLFNGRRRSSRFQQRYRMRCRYGGNGGGGNHYHGPFPNGDGYWDHSISLATFLSLTEDRKIERKKKSKQEAILLTLCSFAVTRAAFSRITKNFVKYYKEQTGKDVRFRLSYGGSGVQARAVIDGLPADIVALALPLDVIKIQQAGLIDEDWQKRAKNKAVFAESVVAIVVRKGNPLNIKDWSDLTRTDVEVITANPKTAGVARWNFLALWGHKMNKGEQTAIDYVAKVFDRVPVQPRDAREASDVFYNQELGDALLTYENEVYMTNQMVGKEGALPYVVPNNNVRVEASVAVIDKNMSAKSDATREAANAFVDYLFTPEAQREFVTCGFRSIDSTVKKETENEGMFPSVKGVWTVEQKLGGWIATQKKFFDADKILDDIQTTVAQTRLKIARQKQKSTI